MKKISLKMIEKKRWLLDKNKKIFCVTEAKEFVDRLGLISVFCNRRLPCLLKAIYTDDLVNRFEADNRLWGFVHVLISEKWAYYGRILGGNNIIISMQLLPSLLQIMPISDYRSLYVEGSLSAVEKEIMDTLDTDGPLMSDEIRRKMGIGSQPAKKRFNRALEGLQRKLLICCAGKIQSRWGWHSGLWATTERWIPKDVTARARVLSEEEARRSLIEKYIYATARTTSRSIARFFKWPMRDVVRIVSSLIDKEMVSSYNHKGETYFFKGNL
ncbi:MAG: winged helix DNA-binding domain-containing protein [candidate division WOR-3 bacterium]|nr:MAG: winged helix DNA-binding domain-containing protein [candidate division WOR-3 bacterium]